MQEYFEQYAEEYVEEVEGEVVERVQPPKVEEIPAIETLEEVVQLLQDQRAKNIVVLSDLPTHSIISSLVICSPFNSRHGSAIAESLRRATKVSEEAHVSKLALRKNSGWFQVDIGSIQVNVMTEELRQRYDLEGLWGAGDEEPEPEIPLIPPPRS